DGQSVASADTEGGVKVWDVRTGQTSLVVRGHTGVVHCVAFHPAGRHLASGGADRAVQISDFNQEVEYRRLGPNYALTGTLSFHPNGRQLATPYGPSPESRGRAIAIWDLETDDPPRTVAAQAVGYTAVAYQPDGEGLALASDDGTLK